ncbi:MAG: TetR family transcriptional regulator C-terminal domain-containing protein [Isosphaeraceae bacterium]|nr:TetR family transcriptional regulator C-terminal domain-containing protein [Isosphaeraceae bacterium]
MSKESTRLALLEAGKRVFLEKGYNSAGLEAILQAAGVPKGSFYYYFTSKEDFGLKVIDRFAECYVAEYGRYLDDETMRPLERLQRYFEAVTARLEEKGCRNGCLIGNLSQEMADQNEAFRTRLEEVLEAWVRRIAACLRQAQRAGEIPGHLDPHELAEFCLNNWEGAILRAKTMRSTAPLKTFLDMMFGHVLRA